MDKQITAILIDDEVLNLQLLRTKLKALNTGIIILAEYQDAHEALDGIKTLRPQLIFLDIEMPRMDGFELLSSVGIINFEVIFVTAYNKYAIEAFKKNAVDYILKPINEDHLCEAITKVKTRIQDKDFKRSHNHITKLLEETIDDSKLIIPTSDGLSFIPQNEIIHLEGDEGYTKIYLVDDTFLLSSYNIGRFEDDLNSNFFKTHKSHVVNITHVRHYENEGYLVLNNKTRLPISRRRKKAFLELFS